MKAKIPEEQLLVALPSSGVTVSPFSHCTQDSAEANAESLLKAFVAVALKRETKHLFCFCSVQFREAKGDKTVDLQRSIDLMIIVSFLI